MAEVVKTFSTVQQLSALLANRAASAVELLDLHLERADAVNSHLNALVTIDESGARAAAEASDRRRANGVPLSELDGIPVSVKDSFETAGVRTTSGAPPLADYVPSHDATAVARLKAAGAVVFAKSNLPPFASDFQTDNGVFGRTNNPWDLSRTPGGSSGGSAAAIAAGLSPLDLGSDIGGSVRQPAHFCGIYSHKPTYELIPVRGHIPPGPGGLSLTDMATAAPLARSASDLAIALEALARPTADERTAWTPALDAPRHDRLTDYRVAMWSDDPNAPVDSQTATMFAQLADDLEKAGIEVARDARPAFDSAQVYNAYLQLVMMWFAAGMEQRDLDAMVAATRSVMPDARRYVDLLAAGKGGTFAEYAQLKEVQAITQHAWMEFFDDYDVMLCPAATTVALPHDDYQPAFGRTYDFDGARRPYGDQSFFWNGALANFALLPSTTRPATVSNSGLPMGLQVIGAPMADRTTIDFAGRLDDVLGGFRQPPMTFLTPQSS